MTLCERERWLIKRMAFAHGVLVGILLAIAVVTLAVIVAR